MYRINPTQLIINCTEQIKEAKQLEQDALHGIKHPNYWNLEQQLAKARMIIRVTTEFRDATLKGLHPG